MILGEMNSFLIASASEKKEMVSGIRKFKAWATCSFDGNTKHGKYLFGKVHEVIPQRRNGKPIARKAEIIVENTNKNTGQVKSEHMF